MTDESTLPDLGGAISAALRAGGEKLRDASNKLSPDDTGAMDESSYVEVDAQAGKVTVGYRSPYALKQHEALGFKHPNGGTAKFLELAAVQQQAAIVDAMADELRRQLGGSS